MKKRFAAIKFVSRATEVPLKFKILSKTPPFITDWYIHKYNPYLLEDTEQFGEPGFIVRLPVTKSQAESEPDKMLRLLKRTIADVCDYSADIAVLDDDFPNLTPNEYGEIPVRIADGIGLFPFFIAKSINKALGILNKDIKECEILIIPGDKNLTLCLLDNIYPHVNYLSVLSGDSDDYSDKIREVFADTGLILRPIDRDSSAFSSADIIINLSPHESFEDLYMQGAVYFSLSGNESQLLRLLEKRDDIPVIDSLRLKIGSGLVSLKYFEAIFYAKSKSYRQLLNHGYDPALVERVSSELNAMSVGISSFFCRKLLLTKSKIFNIVSGIEKHTDC